MMSLRIEFDLLSEDALFLEEYGLKWETIVDGSQWVLLHDFPTPTGYNHRHVTTAIRLETGYPKTPLDMVYFYPGLSRTDGISIGATQTKQKIDNKEFQRWSRHRTKENPWKPGQDNLETHIMLVEDWLEREFIK